MSVHKNPEYDFCSEKNPYDTDTITYTNTDTDSNTSDTNTDTKTDATYTDTNTDTYTNTINIDTDTNTNNTDTNTNTETDTDTTDTKTDTDPNQYNSDTDTGTILRRLSWSAFGRSTGNDVSGHYKHNYFPFHFLVQFFSPSWSFLIEGVLGSKNLFSKSLWERAKTFPDSVGHFGAL